ncbi:MAG TPA: oligoendopeptidase F [Bacteroidota bacterium]|nr:oligoendopeptidase F [Bacteroidota bacterium]
MHPLTIVAVSLFGFLAAESQAAVAQERDRAKIPDRDKWNLTDIYPSDDAWRAAKEKLVKEIPGIKKFQGTLGSSAESLLGCLEFGSTLTKEYSRLASYASMSSDQDTRDSKYLAMKQEMSQVGSTIGAAAAFIEPEILKISRATVEGFMKKEKKLGVYRHYLDDILRRQAHTGSEGEEKIIADAGLMADGPESIFNVFSNADFPYPELVLSNGTTVKLDQAGFSLYRTSANRDDRKKVFASFFGAMKKFQTTYGAELAANVNKDMFYMKARGYSSSLESALDANNIPVQVYHSLVDNVNANLATFHRYLKLRKRILGVDTLHYYDLYAPLLKGVELKYSLDESKQNVLASLAPLGDEYLSVTKKAFSERWIDVYPTDGKRSGAYSNGSAYDVHPFMLLNYNGKYDDMSTLAHELGHTMQSYFSNKTQPYPTADYPIFVAEVASTFNEALLIDHMLKTIQNDTVKLSLLGKYLEGIKGTVFRQTQFAEFELRIHDLAEHGTALTGDKLNEVYMEITKKYYGHDKGICIVDDEVQSEWSYIPHFYYNFYVYQYATAFTASCALSEQVLAGDKAETKRYLDFLSAGGSAYPIELLKNAGVDMTTSVPFQLTMKKMNRVMDEMEEILARMGK